MAILFVSVIFIRGGQVLYLAHIWGLRIELGKSLRLDFFSQRGGCNIEGVGSRVVPRGRHWDPNPNPTNLGLGFGLGSIFQNFGIWTGIDFSKFWDWDRFFKLLGLGLGLGLQIKDKIPRNPKNPKKSQRSL